MILFSCTGTKRVYKNQEGRFARVMFYNTENLFDTVDDPNIDDEEYLPESEKSWTNSRYLKKLENISDVIIALGGLYPPDLIGLSEVENYQVLDDLLSKTMLSKLNYGIIHKDSPDKRGIDVAILYRKDNIKPIEYKAIPVILEGIDSRPTRDILYFKSIVNNTDTIYFFVNHWPSRSGGEEASEPKRIIAAKTLKSVTDSILNSCNNAKIIITGDFNDDPGNNSIVKYLDVHQTLENIENNGLYSLSAKFINTNSRGTLKYKGKWNVFDQFIVSGSLLQKSKGIFTSEENSIIFYGTEGNEFLLEDDTRYLDKQPNRTYWGPNYHNGFSDHLPVYLDIQKR